jgi:predicted membrane-bound mannosyltransferase
LLFSAFLSRPVGILDSYRTYATYLGRAGGHESAHVHPWHYYLEILLYARYSQGPIWTEGWIVVLALVGLAAGVRGTKVGPIDPKLVRFIAVYTVAMTIIYSVLPYKTPWCLLGFLHGLILLAGVGVVSLWTWVSKPATRALVAVLMIAASAHLAFLSHRASFVYYADYRNPYVYAHPTTEIFSAVAAVREYAATTGVGRSADRPLQIAVPKMDYWPFPWYFRDLPCVGYTSSVPEHVGPLIVVSDLLENALADKLYIQTPIEQRRMYMYLFDEPYYIWARPGVKLLGFIRKDLWDEHASRASRQPDPAELMEGSRDRQTPTNGNAVRP